MRLKTLRVNGFKSFADATEFEFPDGITCIVGPNGCGKSNVVDAVKWVLGEQRPSALRGSEMADVIFGGTRSRKPLGMAEVSLLFDNRDGVLDVDFKEVEVTRRLYRDGNSEYLLNRTKCRLRDLRELLMDTGSGPGALTFMEQGRIDQILREGLADRRAVFEEAAGISRYKARRKETLRRLKRVEDDLLRVSDVVVEKERLVRSLKIQAGRAERYKALREEMRAKRLTLAVHHYGRLVEEREGATRRVVDLTAREDIARQEVATAASACEEAETELEASRSGASATETEIATLEGRAETAREKAAFSARLVAELDGKIRWYTDEIEGFAERLGEIETDRVDFANAVEAARTDRRAREQAVQATDATGARAREETNRLRREVEATGQRHYAALQRSSKAQNRVSQLEAEGRGLGERATRLGVRIEAVEEERSAAAEREASAATEFARTEELARTASEQLGASETRVTELDERVGILRDGVQALDRDVSAMKSRQEVLHALVARMEGVGKGPRRLLEAVQQGKLRLDGVRGLLADLIQVDEASASLVETALGEYATAVVVDTLPQAIEAIRHLEGNRLGRAMVLPLDQVRPESADTASPEGDGRGLLDAVQADAAVLAAVRSILSDAVVVDSLDAALRLREGAPGSRLRVITHGGHVLEPGGAMVAGGAPGGAGILQRNAELRQLEERLEETRNRLTAARDELRTVQESLTEARHAVVEGRQQVRAAEGALHRARGSVERVRAETARAEQELERLAVGRREVEQRLADLRQATSTAAAEVDAATAEVDEAERERTAVAESFRVADEASREAEARRADARVELAAIRERCEALEQRAAALEREVGELEEGVEEARGELARSEERRVQSQERGKVARVELEKAQRRRDQCVRELVELRHSVAAAQKALEERRKLRKELDQHAGGVARELNRFRLQQNEAHVRVENLIERIQEELEVDLHSAWEAGREAARAAAEGDDTEGRPDEIPDSTPVFAEPEGAAPAAEPFDPVAYEEQIEDLKGKLQRMGAVNLEALAQLEGAQSEAEHLLEHHEDLTKSRESLLEAIRRIDKESRELFVTTFNAIQANFREMFRKLFGGGRADVFLEPGVDVLEAGVEIVARPPGKEQRSISLLSGGERTMTAVALMFAIYMAHPSPFCLLDEVDAALDEGNIDRFVAAVHMFSEQSQFIIVTHNKRTMTTADTIFGVSMPQPGVSRRLAVRLEDVAEDGQLRNQDAA